VARMLLYRRSGASRVWTASMEAISASGNPPWTLKAAHVSALVIGVVLAIGLWLRLRGYAFGTIALWEDEAAWAVRLVKLPLDAHDIRPLGFMALSKLLASWLSPSETVLRALPWLSGVGALAMAPLLANRLFSSPPARVLFVAIIALHPAAIDLSKEFKPYSVGLALHMGLALLALRYFAEPGWGRLLPLLALALVGTLFSQDVLFTYPGLFVLMLLVAHRRGRLRQLLAIVAAAVMTLGLLLTLYLAFWRHCVGEQTTDYWAKKYDVFYAPGGEEPMSRARWTAEHVLEVAALPGMRHEHWKARSVPEPVLSELKRVDVTIWQVLAVLGVIALSRRRRFRELVLLLGPLGMLVVFNAFGFWPLGAFRTNLFALFYVSAIAAAVFDRASPASARWDLVPVGVLVLAPFVLLGIGIGLVMSPMTTAAMNAVDRRKAGVASGVLSMGRMVGSSFGVAIFGAIVAGVGQTKLDESLPALPQGARDRLAESLGGGGATGGPQRIVDATHDAFIAAFGTGMKISGVVALLGAVVATALISSRRPAAPQAQPAAAAEESARPATSGRRREARARARRRSVRMDRLLGRGGRRAALRRPRRRRAVMMVVVVLVRVGAAARGPRRLEPDPARGGLARQRRLLRQGDADPRRGSFRGLRRGGRGRGEARGEAARRAAGERSDEHQQGVRAGEVR